VYRDAWLGQVFASGQALHSIPWQQGRELAPTQPGRDSGDWGWSAKQEYATPFELSGGIQVQVQVCFTSVCGQVQPLDVALSNSESA
jgi:hypothetical protein